MHQTETAAHSLRQSSTLYVPVRGFQQLRGVPDISYPNLFVTRRKSCLCCM